MPVKFQSSMTTFVKGKGKVTTHSYIKQQSKEDLIKYINNGQKNKVKQKCMNELVRRGIEIVWKTPAND
ncbi:hypothetical protein N9I83_01305 [bacterium]|jgi:hypothetical protein|nr:hypothetical protein [bacterium]|tara:strand:- start:465 stop:671 length:207 start_codon:yes stop_codon:yes gene_type:complete